MFEDDSFVPAAFLDDDGRYVLVIKPDDCVDDRPRAWDLGFWSPGRYVHAVGGGERWQPCEGSRRLGATLLWPFRGDVLRWLGKATKSRTYRSKAAWCRHWPQAAETVWA